MSEFKGTPGPWESKKIRGGLKVIQKGSYEKLAPGVVSYHCVTETENKHDSKLIAAAPELLEALQQTIPHILEQSKRNGYAFSTLQLINRVIAKALGETK